jgi:hypothetical protein
LFVIGTDNAVWTKSSVSGVWSNYAQLGPNPVKAVAATSSSPGRVDLFVIGTDNAVWTKSSVSGVWSNYARLGDEQVSGLAAASPVQGRVDLLVIRDDVAVWTKSSVNGVWNIYTRLPTSPGFDPLAHFVAATAEGPNGLMALVIGTFPPDFSDALWYNSTL